MSNDQIARLQAENEMLLEFVQTLAKADGGILHGYGIVDDARTLLRELAALDSTAPVVALAGELQYKVVHIEADAAHYEHWRVYDTQPQPPLPQPFPIVGRHLSETEAIAHADRLNAARERVDGDAGNEGGEG